MCVCVRASNEIHMQTLRVVWLASVRCVTKSIENTVLGSPKSLGDIYDRLFPQTRVGAQLRSHMTMSTFFPCTTSEQRRQKIVEGI